MVVAPSIWFRDTVTHITGKTANSTFTGFGPGERQQLRCKFRGRSLVRWKDGVEHIEGDAYFLMRKLPGVIRTRSRVEEVSVPPRKAGDRLPASAFPYPSTGLFPSFDVFRADLVQETSEYHTLTIHPGDRILYNNRSFLVHSVQEWDGWNGPDHIKVVLRDHRG